MHGGYNCLTYKNEIYHSYEKMQKVSCHVNTIFREFPFMRTISPGFVLVTNLLADNIVCTIISNFLQYINRKFNDII